MIGKNIWAATAPSAPVPTPMGLERRQQVSFGPIGSPKKKRKKRKEWVKRIIILLSKIIYIVRIEEECLSFVWVSPFP